MKSNTNGLIFVQFYPKTRMACAAGVISLFGLAPLAHAQSLGDALRQTTFQGMVGAINFDYGNSGHTSKSTHSFAIGGHLIAHTGSFDGFSVGLGGYTAQSLGLYSKNNAGDQVHYDGELTGSVAAHPRWAAC